MKKILFTCDLDNTLIHSYKHKRNYDICIEWIKGKEQGFISAEAGRKIRLIKEQAIFVPFTTRSVAQYLRIQWPENGIPEQAITTNGAIQLQETGTKIGTGTGSETGIRTGSEIGIRTGSEIGTRSGIGAGTGIGTRAGIEIITGSEIETENGTGIGIRTETESGTEPISLSISENYMDKAWLHESELILEAYKDELTRMLNLLEEDVDYIRCRLVDDMYVFSYCRNEVDAAEKARGYSGKTSLSVLSSGKKIYFLPPEFNKGNALDRLKRNVSPDYVIAAGDSEMDIPMLERADLAFCKAEITGRVQNKNKMIFQNEDDLLDSVMNVLVSV